MNATREAKAFCRELPPQQRTYAQSYLLWLLKLGTERAELSRSPGYGGLTFTQAQAIRAALREYMGFNNNQPVFATPGPAKAIRGTWFDELCGVDAEEVFDRR